MIDIQVVKKILEIMSHPAVIVGDKEVLFWNNAFASICKFKTQDTPKVLFAQLNQFEFFNDGEEIDFLQQKYVLRKIQIFINNNELNFVHLYVFLTSLSDRVDDLLLSIGHEIKTPLTKIKLAVEILNIKGREKQIIQKACDSLEQTINSLIQAGTTEFLKTSFAVVDIALLRTRILTKYSYFWEVKKIKYHFINQEKIKKIQVFGGLSILERILYSLLDNATEHSRTKIKIQISLIENFFMVKIQDDGLGISKKNLEKVFYPFFSKNTIETNSNTGLGLYIVKKLLHRIGGEIDVESHVNIGTVFTIKLPYIAYNS